MEGALKRKPDRLMRKEAALRPVWVCDSGKEGKRNEIYADTRRISNPG